VFFVLLIAIGCISSCQNQKNIDPPPKVIDVVPKDGSVSIELNEPISFSLEIFGRKVLNSFLYISETPSFLNSKSIELSNYQYLPVDGWKSDQKYYWKLRLYDGNRNTISEAFSFTTKIVQNYLITLLAPVDNDENFDLNGLLRWKFSYSNTSDLKSPAFTTRDISVTYLVYISKIKSDVGSVTPIVTDKTEYTPVTGWNPLSNYYWLVKAVHKDNHSHVYATSEIRHFKTMDVQPGYPTVELLTPRDKQTNVLYDTPITWEATPDNISDILSYDLYIAHSLDELEKVSPIPAAEKNYLPSGGWKRASAYYWKVKACENGNCTSKGPDVFYTQAEDDRSPKINLTSPDNNAQNVNEKVSLEYEATASNFNPENMFFRIYISDSIADLDKVYR